MYSGGVHIAVIGETRILDSSKEINGENKSCDEILRQRKAFLKAMGKLTLASTPIMQTFFYRSRSGQIRCCAKHFVEDDFLCLPNQKKALHFHALPKGKNSVQVITKKAASYIVIMILMLI